MIDKGENTMLINICKDEVNIKNKEKNYIPLKQLQPKSL